MRKTKIVCTIGPASSSPDMLAAMAEAGMNVVRLNTSHGNPAERQAIAESVAVINRDREFPVSILLDLAGLQPRTRNQEPVPVKEGQLLTLSKDPAPGVIPLTQDISGRVAVGDRLLIDDGWIVLTVTAVSGNRITARVHNHGAIKPEKTVTIPGKAPPTTQLTPEGLAEVRSLVKAGVSYLAPSFVKSGADIRSLRSLVGEDVDIVAKIESREGVDNFPDILQAVNGVMIARGDLGVQLPLETLPLIQYDLIKQCNAAGKPVITATQMLNSMIENPRPTRAEVSDVANAIMTGTDAVMLSAETAVGRYPVEVIRMMDAVARQIEQRIKPRLQTNHPIGPGEIVAKAVGQVADSLKARAILSFTETGNTVRTLSGFRIQTPVYGFTTKQGVYQRQGLFWGSYLYLINRTDGLENLIRHGLDILKTRQRVGPRDCVVLAAGIPDGGTKTLAEVRIVE